MRMTLRESRWRWSYSRAGDISEVVNATTLHNYKDYSRR